MEEEDGSNNVIKAVIFQVANICQKMVAENLNQKVAVIVEEEEGNSYIDCSCATISWLQVVLVAVRVRLQQEEDGAAVCTIVTVEGSVSIERDTTASHVQFIAGHDQDSWHQKITAGCDVDRL
ncbi:hypothetical protein B296_00039208 [Ensete ventricosum]|uniref:Uncharacterized protein n=1 Tax=Ensete ventricosum TaxID=4639 RepID=A0A426Y936_ENSVE|nr:hypothetical protein B296_00039208 [Ensete ventricosum]